MTPLNDNPKPRYQMPRPVAIGLTVLAGTIMFGFAAWALFTYFMATIYVTSSPLSPKLVGAAIVTVPVLCSALYVIVSPQYGDADKKWAYGAVGTVLGFWLGAT